MPGKLLLEIVRIKKQGDNNASEQGVRKIKVSKSVDYFCEENR
jgi:hypothetical protein